MGSYSLRALVSVGLLVVGAWLGIALFAKLHSSGGMVVPLVVWAVVMAALLVFAIQSLMFARRARLNRRPEDTIARK